MRLLLLLLVSACGPAPIVLSGDPAPSRSTHEPTYESDATSEGDVAPADDGTSAPRCDVRLDAHVTPQSDGTFVLRATLTSLVGPTEVTLPDPCPNGAAVFRGLPETYDYYGTCNAGACPTTSPRTVSLGESPTVIAETSINPRQGTCNAPLSAGLYLISAELSLPNVRLCTNRAATLTVP